MTSTTPDPLEFLWKDTGTGMSTEQAEELGDEDDKEETE
jgi:hypothetical protein